MFQDSLVGNPLPVLVQVWTLGPPGAGKTQALWGEACTAPALAHAALAHAGPDGLASLSVLKVRRVDATALHCVRSAPRVVKAFLMHSWNPLLHIFLDSHRFKNTQYSKAT